MRRPGNRSLKTNPLVRQLLQHVELGVQQLRVDVGGPDDGQTDHYPLTDGVSQFVEVRRQRGRTSKAVYGLRRGH